MNFKAIITKISLVFFITTLLLIGLFFVYIEYEKQQFIESINQKYENISQNIHQNKMPAHEVQSYLKTYNFNAVDKPRNFRDKSEILRAGKGYELIQYENSFYLFFHTPMFKLLFHDTNKYEKSSLKYPIFCFILILFFFIYYLILKNIKDTKLMLDSRQLFLRTLMHELKTPIAKGRIVSELITQEKQKNRMIAVFEKLNYLIDDFAKVEQIVSKNYNSKFQLYDLEKIIQNSIENLMMDNTDNIIIKNTSSTKLNIDLELFSMALKNLLDNGIKYSNDHKVTIESTNSKILFKSKGTKLPKPLEQYLKPFHNDTKSKNHGMGLGLYIVKATLDIHKFNFLYHYKDGENIFTIEF